MRFKLPLAFLALAILGVGAISVTALAQNADAIAQRRALLKQIGDSLAPVGPMLRRERPFEPGPVQAALDTIRTNWSRLATLFPADSRAGDTRALPAIWERKAEFDGIHARLVAQATTARAAITDEASFRANMPGVLGLCAECHRSFRASN